MKQLVSKRSHLVATNRILGRAFLWRVPRLPRPALFRPVVALPELDLALHQRHLCGRAGKLELNQTILQEIGNSKLTFHAKNMGVYLVVPLSLLVRTLLF